MSAFNISVCCANEKDQLLKFLAEHWRQNHVFVRHPELLAWQHLNPRKSEINFIVARENATGEFVGVLGFMPLAQFDAALAASRDYWWAIFKVRDDQAAKGIGKKIISTFEDTQSPNSIGGIGLSEMVIPIYRKLGFSVGRVNHYYRVNTDTREPSLLGGFDGEYRSDRAEDDASLALTELGADVFEGFATAVADRCGTPYRPIKSPRYFIQRYVQHPYYRYVMMGVRRGEEERGVMVVRKCAHGAARALRLVDYWGDVRCLGGLGSPLQELLNRHRAEYIDVYNLGVASEIFATSGFIMRADDSAVVVPNYFEPYEARNVDLDFMYRNADAARPYVLFKGDSDQDRPNILPAL